MRLAVLSDVHGNLLALQVVRAHLQRQGVDAAINLGDCVSAPLWPRETLAVLDEWNIPMVRGNHDRMLMESGKDLTPTDNFTRDNLPDADRARLFALPESIVLDDTVAAYHGRPSSDIAYLL